jgi:hypothetical protein
MKKELKLTLLSAALAVFAMPVVAQSTPAQTTPNAQSTPATATTPATPNQPTGSSIQQRKENQQDRIANGVKDGQLTAGEATNLEKKETDLNKEEGDMRQMNGGKLTTADKDTLNQQQNQLSHQIYDDKHNGATQPADPKSEVGKRAENQQDRIANGIKDGQLSANQAAHLENNESKINQEVAKDRAANGGKLTQQEKQQVNRQQNRMSRQIHNDRHGR